MIPEKIDVESWRDKNKHTISTAAPWKRARTDEKDIRKVLIEVSVVVRPHGTANINRVIAVLNKIKQRYGLQNALTRFNADTIIVSWTEMFEIEEGD